MDLENLQEEYKTFPYLSSSFESWNPQIQVPSLKFISATYIGSKIWKNPLLKNQVKDVFLSYRNLIQKLRDKRRLNLRVLDYNRTSFYQKNFAMIIDSAVEILNTPSELPVKLIKYCQNVLREMGDKIRDWIDFVEILKFDFRICEKIYWTPNGVINENKIFQSWANNEEFARHKILKAPVAHLLACINVQIDLIVKYQSDMEQFIRTHEPRFHLSNYNDKVYTLMASYLYCFMAKNYFQLEIANMLDLIVSPQYMFQMCAKAGLIKAAFYFWQYYISNKIDLGKIQEELEEACLSIVIFVTGNRYIEGNAVKFLIFLISMMTDEQKNEFVTHQICLTFIKIVHVYPLHEIILELVENYFSQLSPIEWEFVFKAITGSKENSSLLNLDSKMNELRYLFRKMFMKVPDDLKNQIFNYDLISCVFDFDFKCLKLVLSNIDKDARSELIECIRPKILHLVKEGKMEQLNEFMYEILSENERDSCKDYIISCASEILKDVKVEVAEKLFDFLSLAEEERAIFRKKGNSFKICKVLSMKKWRTFRKFINQCLDRGRE